MLCGCKAILSPIPAHKEILEQYPAFTMSINSLGKEELPLIDPSKQYLSPLKSSNMAQQYARLY